MKHLFLFVFSFCVCNLFANDALSVRSDELKSGYVLSDETDSQIKSERGTNEIEIVRFMPKFQYLDSGDIHCVVEFFVQYCQVSSNFHDYAFARNIENSRLDCMKINFLDSSGSVILTIPCINNGQDMVWDMNGVRLVQIHGSFLLTYGRCDYMKDKAVSFYISDKSGNLLTDNGENIIYNLSGSDIASLILNPFSRMKKNFSVVNR